MRDATSSTSVICNGKISIHASHAGRDLFLPLVYTNCTHFNPRVPCGTRLDTGAESKETAPFQSTRPMRDATRDRSVCSEYILISIHASHAGRDAAGSALSQRPSKFQSTRPMRDATVASLSASCCIQISIHASHAGRDSIYPILVSCNNWISIHASHAGRDAILAVVAMIKSKFQSTRPMRDTT